MKTMTITTLTLIAAATVGAAIAVPAPADGSFQSPSGDITCLLGTDTPSGKAIADCEIADHIWVAPPRSPDCPLNWGSRFRLEQGSAAVFACYHQELPAPQQTLDYGQMQSVGVITCDSEPAGMTCTDSSTGHFFRVSRESYQLG
jgi:hypothetical protein